MSAQRNTSSAGRGSRPAASQPKYPAGFWDFIELSNQHLHDACAKASANDAESKSLTQPVRSQEAKPPPVSRTAPQPRVGGEAKRPSSNAPVVKKENMPPNHGSGPSNRYELAYRGKPAAKKEHQCKIQGCRASFDDSKALKKHKYFHHADTHCEKCDLDFGSYQELLSHKSQSENHNACPVEGMEFKSEGALKRHMELSHPRITKCNCPGCGKLTVSASKLIEHFEDDDCPGVSVDQFMKMRVDRTLHGIASEEELDEDQDKRELTMPVLTDADMAVASADESDDSAPGVSMTIDTAAQSRLTAKQKGKARASSEELASMPPFDPEDSRSRAAFENAMPDFSPSPYFPGHNSPSGPSNEPSQLTNGQGGLVTEAALRKLPATKRDDMRQLLQILWGGLPLQGIGDLFDVARNGISAMNPWSSDFNAEYFRGAGGYLKCPYQSCKKLITAPDKLRAHMKTGSHAQWFIRCPNCYKSFHQASQLVAHFETASAKCRAKDQPWFSEVIEIASSGFVGHDFLGSELGHRLRAQTPRNVRW